MANDGSVSIGVLLDESGFRNSINNLGSVAKKGMSATVGAIGAASFALAGFGAVSIKMATDFQKSMAMTSTLFGDVNVDAKQLNKDMLALSSSTGYAANELGDSLYNALSAGVPVTKDMGEALSFMEKSAKLAKGAGAELGSVVDAQTSILNAYKMETDDLDKVQKILIQTQNKGKTTVAELSASLSQVTPTAAAMGVSFEQVGAALATITAQGTPTAQATTQLNSLFAELGKSGTTANKALEAASSGTQYAGKTFQELAAAGVPLSDILNLINDYAKTNGKSMLDMFSSIEAGKSALSLAGQNTEDYIENLEAMSTNADVVGSAYEKMSNTLSEQSKMALEGFKNLGIGLVLEQDSMLSNMGKFANELVARLQTAFSEGGSKGLIGAIGGVLATIVLTISEGAPMMIDAAVHIIQSFIQGISDNLPAIANGAVQIISSLISGVITLIPQILTLGYQIILSLMEGITGQIPALTEQSSGIVSSFISGLSIGIPEILNVGTEILIQLMQGIEDALPGLPEKAILVVRTIVESLAKNIGLLIDAGIEMILALGKALIDSLPTLIQEVPKIVIAIADVINKNAPKLLMAALELIVQLGIGLIQAIPTLIANIPKIIEAIVKAFLAFHWLNLGKQILTALKDGVVQGGTLLVNSFKDIITTIKTNISQLPAQFTQIGSQLITGLWNGITSMKDWLIKNIFSFAAGITSSIKEFFGIESPSKVMRDEVGKPIPAGMAVGIKENKNLVTDAAKELSQKTVESFKGVLDSMIQNSADMVNAVDDNGKKLYKTQDAINKKLYSQAKEFINLKQEQNQLSAEDELDLWKYVGVNFALSTKEQIEVEKNKNKAMETLAKELEQIEKDRFDNSKKWIDNKKKLNELSLAEEYQAWQNIQSQYAQGTDYRIQADEQFFRVKSEIISKIDKLEEDYSKAVESRTQQIFNAYSLFEKIEIKEPISAQEVYDSLEQQVVAFEEWSNNLKILSKRGIDEGLLAELEEAGPKMNREITALTTMSEAQWTEYNKMFVEKRKLANEQATKELAPLQKETQKGIADLVKGIESEFDKGKNIGTSFMDNLSKGIKDNAPKVLEAISKIAEGVIEIPNLFFGADALITALNEAGNNMSKGLGEQIDTFEKWNQSIEGLSSKTINEGLLPDLEQAIPQASEYIEQLNKMTEKGLTTYSKIFKEKSKLARELMMGELSQLHNEASRKTADIIRGIENEFSKSPAVGLNMAQGLANGIRSGMSEVINAAIEVAQEAIRAAKEELDINSPSKKFEEIGKYVDEGFAEGINKNLSTVDNAMANVEEAAQLENDFDIAFHAISDDLYKQGKSAGNDFFEGFTEALKKIDLVVNSTLSNMVPQFAVSGAGSPMNSMVTNNSSNVVQNFYSPTVSPYDVYRKAVLNALR